MDEERIWKVWVPTYHAAWRPVEVERKQCSEYGSPHVALVARREDGLRVVLGTHDLEDGDSPDVLIERQPNGWIIVVRPPCTGDATAYVHMRDDGHVFLQPEREIGPVATVHVVDPGGRVPGFVRDSMLSGRPTRRRAADETPGPCRGCGTKEMGSGDDYNGFCPECADRLFSRTCEVCGGAVGRFGEALRHVDEDGEVDAGADAEHAPVVDD